MIDMKKSIDEATFPIGYIDMGSSPSPSEVIVKIKGYTKNGDKDKARSTFEQAKGYLSKEDLFIVQKKCEKELRSINETTNIY